MKKMVKKKLRHMSELTEEQLYDWFVSIQNMDTVLEIFNGTSAASQILRSILPEHIKALLIAAREDKELIKKMKANVSKYAGTDVTNVNKRMELNKKLARDAIEKANDAIKSRMTSRVGSTTKKQHGL